MSIVCLEQDRGITGCTYSMQSAMYIMFNTHFINISFITLTVIVWNILHF